MRHGIIDEFIVAIVSGFGISNDIDKVPEEQLVASEEGNVHYFSASLTFLKAQCHVGSLLQGPDN